MKCTLHIELYYEVAYLLAPKGDKYSWDVAVPVPKLAEG